MSVSHTGGAEGGFVSVKQEHEEVKWCCSLWIDFLFTPCVMFNMFHFELCACPQLINNTEYNLSRNCDFINADVKEECSSEFPNSSNNEGILFYIFLCLCSVLITMHLYCYNTFFIYFIYMAQAEAHLNLFTTMKISSIWKKNQSRSVAISCEFVRE